MKKYYVHYYMDFSNAYNLAWAGTPEQIKPAEDRGYEQITRKEAEHLCAKEIEARRDDPAFSGFASTVILPIDFDYDRYGDWQNDRSMEQRGHIVDRVR